jgi:hypothetical protein
MTHKDGRFIWIQKSHFTVLIALPTLRRAWLTDNKMHFTLPSIRIYTA